MSSLTYRDAGVDIDAGETLVEAIKPMVAATRRPGVIGGIGGFGALFDLKAAGFSDPVLVSTTDGVGTKLRVAIETGRHSAVGIDLVAMCVNDLVVQGAEPLFFLDYFATGGLDLRVAKAVIGGIAEGCAACGCALVGGETAEMPGMYGAGDYDLAGFAVGAVERGAVLPDNVRAGDRILGLPSHGIHANGFSLVRRVVALAGLDWEAPAPFAAGVSLGEAVMAPTRLYVGPVLALHRAGLLHAAAHITGGGITGNVPRVLPPGLGAVIDRRWEVPGSFRWLKAAGGVADEEMLRVFNCGIGMVLIVADTDAAELMLADAGEPCVRLGTVTAGGESGVRFDPAVQAALFG